MEILERIGFKNIEIKIRATYRIDAKGDIYGIRGWIDRFRYRNKIISAGVYIYAEK